MNKIKTEYTAVVHNLVENPKDLPKGTGFYILGFGDLDNGRYAVGDGYYNKEDKSWYTQVAKGDGLSDDAAANDPNIVEWHLTKKLENDILFWISYPRRNEVIEKIDDPEPEEESQEEV